MTTTKLLPASLAEIVEPFASSPPRERLEPVPECQSPLFGATQVDSDRRLAIAVGDVSSRNIVSPLRLRGASALLGRIQRQVREQQASSR